MSTSSESTPRSWRAAVSRVIRPFKFVFVLVVFLATIIYTICISLLSGLGMLSMYLVMPSFMTLVYPSCLGRVHTWLLGVYRGCFIAEDGHSRSIRIDLAATAADAVVDAVSIEEEEGLDTDDDRAEDEAMSAARLPYSVHTIACLTDNYCYMIVDRSGPPGRPHAVALVDPCEPKAVLRALQKIEMEEYSQYGLQPVAVLTTHHHWDHAGGNTLLVKTYPRIAVYGGKDDKVAACTHPLADGDEVMVGALRVQALHVPCHTRGSTCFVIQGPTPSLFGGDTFFCGGCGAPFEGTQAEMLSNFVKIWRACAPNTLIFPGHEYTTAILPGYVSGSQPLPDHPAAFGKVCSLLWRAQQQRSLMSAVPTVPFLLNDELLFNTNFSTLRHAAEVLAGAYYQYAAFLAHRSELQAGRPGDFTPAGGDAEDGGGAGFAVSPRLPSVAPPLVEGVDRPDQSLLKAKYRAMGKVKELSNLLITGDEELEPHHPSVSADVTAATAAASSASPPPSPPNSMSEMVQTSGTRLDTQPSSSSSSGAASSSSSLEIVSREATREERARHGDVGFVLDVGRSSSAPDDDDEPLQISIRGGGGEQERREAARARALAALGGATASSSLSMNGAPAQRSDSRGGYWSFEGVAVLPAQELRVLEHALAGANVAGALNALSRMRSVGALPASTLAEGAPINARVAHAEVPRFARLGDESGHDTRLITTDDVSAAFETLNSRRADEPKGCLHGKVLRAAVTSAVLLRRPLSAAQAEDLLRTVKADEQGLVHDARFNALLAVLPPMPPPPPSRGRCERVFGFLRRRGSRTKKKNKGKVASRSKYHEAAALADTVSDDGNVGADTGLGLRPIAL